MSTITATRPIATPFAGFARLFGAIGAFFAGIREGKAMADRYAFLSRLSDAELARRGLTRAGIVQAVVHGSR
jgi:hypothetical protein